MSGTETLRTWVLLQQLRAGVRRSQDQLFQQQDTLLRRAIAHAYGRVPFYRRLWNEAGFDVQTFRGLQDVSRIPLTTRQMVRQAARQGELLAQDVDTHRCTFLDTSGSSGKPLRIWKQPLEERLRRAVGLRIWFEHGFRWNHRTAQFQILPGPAHFLQQCGISRKTWISTAHPIEEQLVQFLAAKADVVVGTPTALRRITRAIEESGAQPKRPRLVFGAGELIDRETRHASRHVFGVDPVEVYGQTEVGYVAWQCERRVAFHINADTHLVEVIRNGRPAGPGELGKIVITDLRARTMPFIRYDTTDLAIVAPEPCPCGRRLPVLQSIEGRTSGSFVLRDGRILTTREVVDSLAGTLRMGTYRLHQEAIDGFRLELVSASLRKGENHWQEEPQKKTNPTVSQKLSALLGVTEVTVENVPPWPPDGTGKTQAVFSAVPLPGLE